MPKLIRMKELTHKTGLSRAAIYAKLNKHDVKRFDATFPKSVPLSNVAVAWVDDEVDAWIAARIAERDTATKEN